MEVQQSSLYRKYILSLGWQVARIDGSNVFFRYFPLLGGMAKVQRPLKLPKPSKLIPLFKQQKIRLVALEPDLTLARNRINLWCRKMGRHFKINRSPYLPTKNIFVDLSPSEELIFKRFTESKRRGVRRALKNNVIIKESSDIQQLIMIKNKSAGLFGFITTTGTAKLWPIFAPRHAAILLAYRQANYTDSITNLQSDDGNLFDKQILGGVLLLFWEKKAYYWIAGATRQGKKLAAPTLLVWEALKLAKSRGCRQFDFLGVWDERLPLSNRKWLGFTKFKEGFGGKEVYYPTYL